jgi:hypothetical protein
MPRMRVGKELEMPRMRVGRELEVPRMRVGQQTRPPWPRQRPEAPRSGDGAPLGARTVRARPAPTMADSPAPGAGGLRLRRAGAAGRRRAH